VVLVVVVVAVVVEEVGAAAAAAAVAVQRARNVEVEAPHVTQRGLLHRRRLSLRPTQWLLI